MKRRKTRQIKLGNLKIGGDAPISIQSMTRTDTKDISTTVREIKRLQGLGCEVIRVAVKDGASAYALSEIKKEISIPIEADIHFNYRLAILAMRHGADGIRLNPGNITNSLQVKEVIRTARVNKVPIRIGVNSGSLPSGTLQPKTKLLALVKTVTEYLKIFERERFYDIMISVKTSNASSTIDAYRMMAGRCDYPFHLGVTATGQGTQGIVKSAIGIGTLLAEGIGDTIRVSLIDGPEDEILVAKEILQSLKLRQFVPEIISCPTCGRCQVDLIKIVGNFKKKLAISRYPLFTKPNCSVAIMGCEVNGPGEAKEADIGVAFGKGLGVLFKRGRIVKRIRATEAVKELFKLA